jgi:hypothetical protein
MNNKNNQEITMSYVPKTVATKADIDKKIEIEAANLMHFDFKSKDDAFKEAKIYIENKYQDVVAHLKNQGLY